MNSFTKSDRDSEQAIFRREYYEADISTKPGRIRRRMASRIGN